MESSYPSTKSFLFVLGSSVLEKCSESNDNKRGAGDAEAYTHLMVKIPDPQFTGKSTLPPAPSRRSELI